MLQKDSVSIRIVIPSRYQSTRLPGKPLIKIAGVELVKRVAGIASLVCEVCGDCDFVVATDDARIFEFCENSGLPVLMTRADCANGTERCWDAVINKSSERKFEPKLVINMQGDNPLCPPHVIRALIESWRVNSGVDLFTPSVRLSWEEFDGIIETKKSTPYSGTTVLVDRNNFALAFSKAVIPVVRDIVKAKKLLSMSPVCRHVGVYAYTFGALRRYVELAPSDYELSCVEGLEQMRFLENGMRIKVVPVDYGGQETTGGVDSPEDIERVEAIIAKYGDPYKQSVTIHGN
ncbi:MAG: 3-deoxy-manno-octulosonate cytidylyltransferase [Planctomycetaceae bacterium]|jgi:3-deoxy-manno-octulosonate cytidylyltransferase (CMP-KDO synthetase)|nr:3-deoxy-manno-octulosonate cytidylyltransferase [Planctomycetaceae bacterium]